MRRAGPIGLIIAIVASLGAGLFAAPREAAAELESIDAWVVLSSTRPGVGCAISASVEVHASGAELNGVEVSLAFFIDEELVSADRGVTSSGGVAYLSLDTSAAYSGANGWLDVNVGGSYLTGLSILPAAGNGCEDGGTLISASALIPIETAAATSTEAVSGGGVSFWVPTYVQQRNLSCEYASLYIATAAWGNAISEYAFDDIVGWSPNPHWGYRGDINGWWGNTWDYGVYPEVLASALANFGFAGDVFYAQGNAGALTSRLDAGVPVVVWLGLWGDQSIYEEFDGVTYKVVAGMHVMVAYGYDDEHVYLSDPAIGGYRSYTWGSFMSMWNVLDGMSLGVAPA